MNMRFYRKLPIPQDVKAQIPVTELLAARKAENDRALKDVFVGKSDRFILIIGPCSADKPESVLEYIGRLKEISDQVKDRLVIVPRVYTTKPRTTGDGYKGMVHQPDPSAHPDMLKGIVAARELHLSVLRDYGFSCADEMLYPDNHRYFSDLLSYVTVGARSVENQQHRLTASGLDIPVGMKNPTGGDLSVMMNAVHAAQKPHTFIYRGWEVESTGNPLAHAVLRGYVTPDGKDCPNYSADDLNRLLALYGRFDVTNPAVIVDANHANSDKDCFRQIEIVKNVLESRRQSGDLKRFVKGMMVESYLEDGAQPPDGTTFGQSITDPCLGWEKTQTLIYQIAENV